MPRILLLALVALTTLAGRAAWAAGAPTGLWLTQDRHGVVEITPCEAGLCGRIVGIGQFKPDGSTPTDIKGESDCHLPLMPSMKPIGDNLWRGNIYDPQNGETYDAQMQVDEQDRLQLRGFIVLPILGSTQVWTRYNGQVTEDCHMSSPD